MIRHIQIGGAFVGCASAHAPFVGCASAQVRPLGRALKRTLLVLPFFSFLVCGFACKGKHGPPAPATTRPDQLTEDQKIETLISSVAAMKDVTFIRNGSEYSASAAAELMRYKWNRDSDQIKTARDFIRVAGTKSSTSGREYRVRLANGREVSSADFLLDKLKEIETPRRP